MCIAYSSLQISAFSKYLVFLFQAKDKDKDEIDRNVNGCVNTIGVGTNYGVPFV